MRNLTRILSLSLFCLSLAGAYAADSDTKGKLSGGADYQSGWIIKRTKDGIVKIPRKQGFVFEGSGVEGDANRPSTGVFGTRPDRDRLSLIPIRKSFRREALSASGLVSR